MTRKMVRLLPLVMILIVILSGCTATSPATEQTPTETPTERITDVDITTSTSTDFPTETTSPTNTETATLRPDLPDNPWRKEPIVIGIDSSADPDRNYSAQVIDAVEYWHEIGEGRTAWSPNFTIHPDAKSPDIVIRFVNEIQSCGTEDGNVTIGCARVLQPDSTPSEPEIVLINIGLTNESTYRTARHELGHTLGLNHGEGPGEVMQPYDQVFNQIVRVHIEFETTADHEKRDTRRQMGYVFDYYSSGADGFLTEDVEFASINDREAADIIIEVNKGGSESRARFDGGDFIIEINGINTNRRGWHIGYWFGFYFGANSTDELPPPFDEPESDSRTQWWH